MIIIYLLYSLTLFLFGFYSYALIDPNLTLVNSPSWVTFQNYAIQLGYYNRPLSSILFIVFILLLTVFHLYFVRHYKHCNAMRIALITSLLLLLSYPFLSHDLFNYIFDAKILTFYHLNPYTHRPMDFNDDWLRFMHWIHRTYPYGPTFLPITLIPSFLGMGKFIMNFFLFKLLFSAFYFLAVFYIDKINRKWSTILATQPLIIIEGLVNSHNDLIALSLALLGIYALFQKKELWGRILILLSAGIKYITLPLIALTAQNKKWNVFPIVGLVILIVGVSFKMEIQPWYFLSIFALIPYYEKLVMKFQIFYLGLLASYYPYIRFGPWNDASQIDLKHIIILISLVINIIFLMATKSLSFSKLLKRPI